jgi:hypothetical protein
LDLIEQEVTKELKATVVDSQKVLDDALEDVIDAEAFIKIFSSQIKFFGKSIDEWEESFAIAFPSTKQLSPDMIRELHIVIANNIQIASHYYSICTLGATALKNSLSVKKTDVINSLLLEYSSKNIRAPSQAQLEKMVNLILQKLNNISMTSAMFKHYWREKLDMLDKVEKSLNSIAISQAVEMRHLES